MVLNRLIEVCQTLPRNGGVAIDDPLVRQKIGQMMVEIEVLRYAGCACSRKLEKGQRPGPSRRSTSCTTARWTSGTRS